MVVAPMLNGGRMENKWQPMSQLTWCGPSSRSTSLMAVKIGRSGHPVQNDGGRAWTWASIGAGAIGTGAVGRARPALAAVAAAAGGAAGEALATGRTSAG